MKRRLLFVSSISCLLPIQAWVTPAISHRESLSVRQRSLLLPTSRFDTRYRTSACRHGRIRPLRGREQSLLPVLQATAKAKGVHDLTPERDQRNNESSDNVVVKAFQGVFQRQQQQQLNANSTKQQPEEEKDTQKSRFSFPKFPFFKSTDDDAKPASNETRTSLFRSMLWNRTTTDQVNATISSASREASERLRRDKERDRVRKDKDATLKKQQKQQQQRAKQTKQQQQDSQINDDRPPPWPMTIFTRVQSAAVGLFNNTNANSTSTIKPTRNDTGSSSNPFGTVQKFWTSSTSFIYSATNSASTSSNSNKEEWVIVLPKTRLMPGVIVPVTVAGGLDLLVIASKDGRRLYAIENSCPHLGTPLETGQLVRLPVEESTSAGTTGGTLQQQPPSPSDSFQSKLSGAFNGPWSETEVSKILQQDGCEDCIVCPLHRTSFALQSGAVRGEWCPYPPILGKLIGNVKAPTGVAVFDVRTRGKNVEIRINTPIIMEDG